MAHLVDSDIQRLVACLVLGYLENQQLEKTYRSFCDSSRHLAKEKKTLKNGNKMLDTSFGLVNIIREYYSFKAKFTEFLRVCPKSSTMIKLIDADDTLSRLDIVLQTITDNLHKFDKIPTENNKKRRHSSSVENFDISDTNASTPEAQNVIKKRRRSVATPFITVSSKKEVKTKSVDKTSASRAELDYRSSSETSSKDGDDDEEEEKDAEKVSSNQNTASSASQVLMTDKALSETLLEIPQLHEQLAELINKTRSNELDTKPSKSSAVNIAMTNEDIDNLLSVTRNDPEFEDMIADLVDKFHNTEQNSASSTTEKLSVEPEQVIEEKPAEEVPIKQRLRQRVESKPSPMPAEKKEKCKILSNEILVEATNFSSQLPNLPQVVLTVPQMQMHNGLFMHNGMEMVRFVPSAPMITQASTLLPNMQAFIAPGTSSATHQNQPVFAPVISGSTISLIEKKQTTPKVVMHPSFIKSASRSTPRHVRTLDFSQTPSHRPSTLVECKTPLSRIPDKTPGSAPALMSSVPAKILQTTAVETIPEIDDNSNSNSIQNTPKVVKNRRRRKIAEVKSEPKSEEKKLVPPSTNASEEWARIRSHARMPVDEIMRQDYERNQKQASPKKGRKRPATVSKKNPKKVLASKNKSSSHSPEEEPKTKEENSTEYDENKPLSSMKTSGSKKCPIKITSPRKALKKSPKKKKTPKKKPAGGKLTTTDSKRSVKKSAVTVTSASHGDSEVVNESNRSDTVQDVADALLNLSTGLKENGATRTEPATTTTTLTDSSFLNKLLETPFKGLLETPLKITSITPLPNTPHFAIPIFTHTQETPLNKIAHQPTTFTSIIKNDDILTPMVAITPDVKNTPAKDGLEGSPHSGYNSRKTDYSSSSSYYKPDECDQIDVNAIINQRKSERQSQSESDGGASEQRRLRVPGSVKKVECLGAIERVKSFTEEQTNVPTPHYQMMEDGFMIESNTLTATDDSNASSSTCTTCSTCSSSSGSSNEKDKKLAEQNEDNNSEWEPDTEERAEKVELAVNQATGEVRFPLRNWMTPKKIDIDERQLQIDATNRIKSLLKAHEPPRLPSIEEEQKRKIADMEATKKRTLEKIRRESCAANKPKLKKVNVKNFKLPAESQSKQAFVSRKDQILNQQLTERPRPTPLMVLPSSSSRRKNATPRKTIVINELPRQPSPIKKKKAKLDVSAKSPEKANRLSLESLPDNAVMPEDSVGHELSSSLTSNDEETANTVVEKVPAAQSAVLDEGSNTFQKSLIAQGFNKNDAMVLQHELVDKLEEHTVEANKPEVPVEVSTRPPLPEEDEVVFKPAPPPPEISDVDKKDVAKDLEMTNETMDGDSSDSSSSSGSDSEDDELELTIFTAAENERNVRNFVEAPNFKPFSPSLHHAEIPKTVLRIDGRVVTLQDSGLFDIFSVVLENTEKPTRTKKVSPKKAVEEKKNGKEVPAKNGKLKQAKELPKAAAASPAKPKTPKFNTKPARSSKTSAPVRSFDIDKVLDVLHG